MKFRQAVLSCVALLASVCSFSQAARELPSPQPCIYTFPNGEVMYDNIATLLPQSAIGDYACTVLSGGIASVNGFYPLSSACSGGKSNGKLSILVKDEFEPTKTSFVSHLTLGKNIHYYGTSLSVHSAACVPTRLNVCSAFTPYSALNLSGRVQADLSQAPLDGVKIYSAGATILGSSQAFGRNTPNEGDFITWEIADDSTMLSNFSFASCAGYKAEHGQVDHVRGGFIFQGRRVESAPSDESGSVIYPTLSILGDFTTPCPKCEPDRHVTFYSVWEDGNKKLNLPGSDTPLFICNSIDPALPGLMHAFALNKLEGKGMEPIPTSFNIQYKDLGQGSNAAEFDAVLHPDGRVHVFFFALGGKAVDPLADARVISKPEEFAGSATLYRLMPGAVLDMTRAGDFISLDNITAGTLTHGAGIVQVAPTQQISITSDKTIRHSIHGAASMSIKGEKEKPITVSFERLLKPRVDKAQALYELKEITADHARLYIGPANIVGGEKIAKASMLLGESAEVFNYGVLNADIRVNASSRLLNSHYAGTSILKHKECGDENVKIPVKSECYPGTISGSVFLREGSEFCNYGTVLGDITVAENAVLYGCGTCKGSVTVSSGGVYYVDYALHKLGSCLPFVADMNTDFSILRPGNECANLKLEPGSMLAFRVGKPLVGTPNILHIADSFSASSNLTIRVDIDGSIVDYFSSPDARVLLPLVHLPDPHKGAALKRSRFIIASGAALVQDAELVWNKKTCMLCLSVKLSKAVKNHLRHSKPAKKRRSRH